MGILTRADTRASRSRLSGNPAKTYTGTLSPSARSLSIPAPVYHRQRSGCTIRPEYAENYVSLRYTRPCTEKEEIREIFFSAAANIFRKAARKTGPGVYTPRAFIKINAMAVKNKNNDEDKI